jgi:DnaJ-class molecular chaperone
VVSPGTQSGTKLVCRGAGHERIDGSFQDIVFIIEQIPHDQFLRLGHDLAMRIRIPWSPKLKLGGKIAFAGIGGEERLVRIGHPLSNALKGTSTVAGAGMPVLCKGNIIGRGNIIVKWVLLALLLDSSC